jgi:predicted dehydrogenase
MQNQIKVAIAGQGRSGYSIHARGIQDLPQYKIVAVADEYPERRKEAEKEFGAKSFSNYKAMLKKGGFDLFVNALPTHLHVPATIEALTAGFNVVCEKPMTPTLKQFDRVLETAGKAKRLIAPFQNNRLQPFFFKLQEIISSGVIGEILYIQSSWSGFRRRWDWQTLRKYFGGTLYNTAPHAIDQILALIGFNKKPEVDSYMICRNKLGGDAEDFAFLTLKGKNIPLVELTVSMYQAYSPEYIYIISGTLGGIAAGAMEIKWRYYNPEEATKQKFWKKWSVNRQYPDEKLPWQEKVWKYSAAEEKIKRTSGYTLKSFPSAVKLFYENIYEVLTEGKELLIKHSEVREQIRILDEAHRQSPIWKGFLPA